MPLGCRDRILACQDRVHHLPRLSVVDLEAALLARAADLLARSEEVPSVPGPGQSGDFASCGVGDGARAYPCRCVPEGDYGVRPADCEVVSCWAVGDGGAGRGVGGESVERGEGRVVKYLDAFALCYQEVRWWVCVGEGGLVCADLLRVFGEDAGGGGCTDGDEDVGFCAGHQDAAIDAP